tara:strand:+ start:205 stop:1269 length:1065 start_codon:yes stop_codon:yes gene_type:complete
MKITISQLRKIIREQFQAQSGPAPRTQMSLEDTGPFMRNAIVRSAMGEINHWKGLTTEWETTQQYQTMNVDKPTFESYVDSALDEIRAKVDSGDFTVPQNMVGMREMKINKADLKRMIKEEFSSLSEVYHGDPYAQHGGDPSANILPSKPPAHWRPRQRAAWNKLKAYRSDLATPDNYGHFEKAYNKLLVDFERDTHDPEQMASMLSMVALEAQGLGPPGGTTGYMDLDEKLRGLPPGHVDLSQLSESRIDLGRWNKMAGTLLCEASDLESEQAMFDDFEARAMQGRVQARFLDWANQVLVAKGLPTATPGDDSNLYQIGNSALHGMPIDAWRAGVQPEDYASEMEVLPPRMRV